MPRLPTLADVNAAARRIEGIALRTPLEPAPALAEEVGAGDVRLKREELQPTGSFKTRGAHNKVGLVAEGRPEAALVTASTGNHGIAVATAAVRHDMRLSVLVGRTVSPAKLARLRTLETRRITVELIGDSPEEAEAEARRRDDAGLAIYVPPYNDPDVVAGQGTIGLEITADWPDVDTILVPVGGGGLIAGIGLWAKAVKPALRLIGIQPAASPTFYAYMETGTTDPMPIAPTLADAVAGNNERTSITWELCRKLVDEVVLVDEDEIADAMRWAIDVAHTLLEGSAVLGIAALRTGKVDVAGRNVCVVTTGRNVATETVTRVLSVGGP